METKSQRNARLKQMRKKYGLGEFQNKKTKVVRKTPMARKKFRFGGKGRGSSMMNDVLKGVGAASLSKRFIGNNDLIALAAAGYTGGFAGAAGAVISGQASLPNLSGVLGGVSNVANGGW